MKILVERLAHPYIREIHFTESDVSSFQNYGHCPSCGSTLGANGLAHLAQTNWKHFLGLVQCQSCDHIYYANPPGPDWFEWFYRSQWNADRGESVAGKIAAGIGVKDTAARLVADLDIKSHGKLALEIGCGAGDMMAGLAPMGFAAIHGTEASDYRAARTALRFPRTVYKGGYEAVPTGQTFDFIYSHHVVEHVYDPWMAFNWMVERLNPGGVISITVPNAKSEPVLNQLLFVPHLHSFCHRSLMKMGENCGFDVAFWTGANTPYEITAVYCRKSESRRLGKAFVMAADAGALVNEESMLPRFSALCQGVTDHDTVHFALHAGEKGASAMSHNGGLRRVSTWRALASRLTSGLGRRAATLGLRKFGNKWLGRNRTLTVHRTSDGSMLPVIGSVAGDVVLHIK